MNLVNAVRAELARITSSRMATISLVALMCIPIIYGSLYLWGNRDPYGKLNNVPAALVVEDTGASVDGAAQNYGAAAADTLVQQGTFKWHRVASTAQAEAEVKAGKYDFALVFPADFSTSLASAATSEPQRASLRLITDDTNSYLSSTIATQTATAVRDSVAAQVAKQATTTLLDGVARLRDGLAAAHDGAAKLADGVTSAQSGASSVATGASSLASGASVVASGSGTAASGAASLKAGLDTLGAGTAELPSQAAALDAGAAKLASGASQLQSTALPIAEQLLASSVPGSAQQQQAAALVLALGGSVPGVAAPSQSLGTLITGAQQLQSGTAALSAQAPTLASGIQQADAGAAKLAAGTAQLHSGAASLSTGAATLADGAASLASGSSSLADGATQLRDQLGDGVAKAPAYSTEAQRAIAAAVADPLAVDRTAITKAQNYGAGLAPYFTSLALWVGMYALFLLVRPLSRRALTAVRRPLATTLAGWLTPAALGAVQALGLYLALVGPLGFRVANPLGLLAFFVLVSACYAAIVLALNAWFGSVGQFLGLLLMVVQLVTAGGTFPWQTLPPPLAVVHQWLPMSFAVQGVRDLMYGSGAGAEGACLVLVLWLVCALAATAIAALRKTGYRGLAELRPSAIGG